MAETAAPTEGVAAWPAAATGGINQSPAPEGTPIIPPEIRAIRTPAADAMEVTTLLTESEALVGALEELTTSMEGEDGGKLVKARYLSLKAQLAMMKVVSAENRQVGEKNVEALDQVVRELGNQQEKLQNMTDDIGGSLLAMSRGFTSLSEVLKGLYSKQRMEAQESENRHNRMNDCCYGGPSRSVQTREDRSQQDKRLTQKHELVVRRNPFWRKNSRCRNCRRQGRLSFGNY